MDTHSYTVVRVVNICSRSAVDLQLLNSAVKLQSDVPLNLQSLKSEVVEHCRSSEDLVNIICSGIQLQF